MTHNTNNAKSINFTDERLIIKIRLLVQNQLIASKISQPRSILVRFCLSFQITEIASLNV